MSGVVHLIASKIIPFNIMTLKDATVSTNLFSADATIKSVWTGNFGCPQCLS